MEFLVFGEDYNRHPSSTQHLINEIKKKYRVQWVNSIGMRKPKINKTDIFRIFEKLTDRKVNIYPEEELNYSNLEIVKPLVYPLAENPFLVKLNKLIMKKKIHRKKDLKRIVWLTLPSAIDYLEVTEGDFVVYYCCDDFTALAGVDHKVVEKKEQELIKKSDLIFTTSEELYKKFKSDKTVMLPHGVHDCFFNIAQKEIEKENITLGFYGGIDTRLDYKLIEDLLSKNENLNLEMIGHIDAKVDKKFFKNPRIKHHGALQHNELVKRIEEWDILLLPFLHNGYATHCNPLKLREYLATGKPVISTDIPAVHEYEGFLEIQEGYDSWLAGIDNFCNETKKDKNNRVLGIREKLSHETWKHRSEEAIISIIKNQTK
jgi:glycosyltransferase involved in cell wall biosynthesis